jgi:hypothetical protein
VNVYVVGEPVVYAAVDGDERMVIEVITPNRPVVRMSPAAGAGVAGR